VTYTGAVVRYRAVGIRKDLVEGFAVRNGWLRARRGSVCTSVEMREGEGGDVF
jgi:hypothetical protein